MSTLTNLKNSIANAELEKKSETGISIDPASSTTNPLKTALSAARKNTAIEETLKAKDSAELAEEQVMRLFEEELVQENFDTPASKATAQAKASAKSGSKSSARLLELQRKQASCAEMQSKIRDSASLVSNLVSQADTMNIYLEKIEVELAQLENIEEKATALSDANAELKRRHDEDKLDLQEKMQQIAVLETQKTAHRDTIDKAKIEIARLNELTKAQKSEIGAGRALAAKLESDLQSVFEKLEIQQREHKNRLTEQNGNLEKLTKVASAARQKDKELARISAEFDDLQSQHQAQSIELADMGSKYASQTAKSLEQKSELEEARFEASSARSELEKTLRMKDARIAELEAKLELHNHRPTMGDDEVFRLPPVKSSEADDFAKKANKKSAKSDRDVTLN